MSRSGERPRLHLAPRSGWLNDPLALTWRPDEQGGRYHLFFQHVPEGTTWAAHCGWGHATSVDLLEWSEQPLALAPADDELGAWSGCLVGDTILYTSVLGDDRERGRVRLARPLDERWQRWQPGKVVLQPPADPAVTTFRDPVVVRDGGRWRMLVGAGTADGTGCALGFVSDDLTAWEPTGVVASRHTTETDPVWTGSIWECPQLLRLPHGDVLVVSTADTSGPGDVVAVLGSFEHGRFDVTSWHRLTTGAPYAASAFTDREGRAGLVTWLRGVAGDGWAGAVSVPLVVDTDGEAVRVAPHPAVAARRGAWDPAGSCWDVEWEGEGELVLLGPAGEEQATLRCSDDGLIVSTGGADLTLPLGAGAGAGVRLLRDGPVLEVCSGGRLAAAPVPPGVLRPEGRGWRGWALA